MILSTILWHLACISVSIVASALVSVTVYTFVFPEAPVTVYFTGLVKSTISSEAGLTFAPSGSPMTGFTMDRLVSADTVTVTVPASWSMTP